MQNELAIQRPAGKGHAQHSRRWGLQARHVGVPPIRLIARIST